MKRRQWSVLTAAMLGLASAGCGVKQGALDLQIAAVRTEMHEADSALAGDTQRLSNRVDQLDQRVDVLEVVSVRVEDFEVELQSVRRYFDTEIDELQQAVRFNSPVHFEYDSHAIRDADRRLLDRFATIVATYYPTALITVEGFADPAGDTEYNVWLGEQRAEAVRSYLTSMGLAAQRVRAVSYGESGDRQVTPGGWGENGLANRRVSLVIDYSPDASEILASPGSG